MSIQFVKSAEKKRIIEELNRNFGISKIPYLLIKSGKNKLRGFSGSLSKEELQNLDRDIRIEFIGIYLLKNELSWRISLDACQILQSQINKGIIEISDEDFEKWIRGKDLEKKSEIKGTAIIKYKNDFIGCGKSSGEKIFNYIPKERRIKS